MLFAQLDELDWLYLATPLAKVKLDKTKFCPPGFRRILNSALGVMLLASR